MLFKDEIQMLKRVPFFSEMEPSKLKLQFMIRHAAPTSDVPYQDDDNAPSACWRTNMGKNRTVPFPLSHWIHVLPLMAS